MPINCKTDCRGQKDCAHPQSASKAVCRFLDPGQSQDAPPGYPSNSSGLLVLQVRTAALAEVCSKLVGLDVCK